MGLATRANNGKYHIFFDFILDDKNIFSSDSVQFNRANKKLFEELNSDLSFRRDMLKRYPELSSWKVDSKSPPGLTWHHHEDLGRLSLVDRTDHSSNHALYHPTGKGGRDIWGGGEDGRRGKLDGKTGELKSKGSKPCS